MEKYSALQLVKHAFSRHKRWPKAWDSPTPLKKYDVVIVGGGGHGLATAYYLAKEHNITNVAVLEKGWIGGGNTGRNTTVVRSNYFYPQSTNFFEHSLKLYENLSIELNQNVMLSQDGILTLGHSRHDMETLRRWANSMQLQGIESEVMNREQVKEYMPLIDTSSSSRFPIWGGFIQRRGGVVRHDSVAWGYARSANALGVHILQGCEVLDILKNGNSVTGVKTNLGTIRAEKILLAVAGHTSELGRRADLRLPIVSQTLQAMVSEPVKPCLSGVVLSGAAHAYVSQSDRGEILIGGGTDRHVSYGQRGNFPILEETLAATLSLFPCFSRLKLMRQWAGVVDIAPDSSPIMGKTPVAGLYVSGGWGTGGFKAIPAGGQTMAYTIATDKPHELIEPFGLNRFVTGALIDEGAAAGVAH